MDLVISQLDQKYQEFLSALDRKSFYDTFRSVYDYFDIIQSQDDLQKIIAAERQNIEDKKQVVNSDEKLTAKDKKEVIKRIEDQSYSFGYNKINERIYLPMKKYKESLTLSPKESLTGRALAVKEQSKNTGEYLTDIFFSFVFGNIEPAKIFWTKFKYLCFTDNVAVYMEKLHSGLIKKKLELPVITFNGEKPISSKIKIIIDDNKGIYQEGKELLAYNIERISKRMKLIKHLVAKDNCSLSELNGITRQDKIVTMKSIPEINELFKSKLDLNDDLILSIDTGGYSINKDVYAVTIKR
ncbi:MAG: hypothetical protein NT077_00600 [Candidatus Taylorbacteria bacterium]|nr:hypothetical protein [Candidatus Taylorbacteria bacterium]